MELYRDLSNRVCAQSGKMLFLPNASTMICGCKLLAGCADRSAHSKDFKACAPSLGHEYA